MFKNSQFFIYLFFNFKYFYNLFKMDAKISKKCAGLSIARIGLPKTVKQHADYTRQA